MVIKSTSAHNRTAPRRFKPLPDGVAENEVVSPIEPGHPRSYNPKTDPIHLGVRTAGSKPSLLSKAGKAEVDPLGVSVSTAAAMISVARSTMAEMVRQGKVRSTRIGGRRIVIVASLRELLGEAA